MKYIPYNVSIFGINCVLGVLIYLLTVGALAGLAGADSTPCLNSSLWPMVLIAFIIIIDLFFAFAFRIPLGGLSSHIFPSRRKRLLERFKDTD